MLSLNEKMAIGLLINLFKCNSIDNDNISNNQCHINENNILIYDTTPNIPINTSEIIHPMTLKYDIEINTFHQCTNLDLYQHNYFSNTSLNTTNNNLTNNNTILKSDEPKEANTPITNSFNFASFDSGAIVLDKSDGIKSSKSILSNRKDKYMMMPCELNDKWFVIQLSEDIVIDRIEIINLEHYSSNIKNIRIYARTSNDNNYDGINENDTNSHDWISYFVVSADGLPSTEHIYPYFYCFF